MEIDNMLSKLINWLFGNNNPEVKEPAAWPFPKGTTFPLADNAPAKKKATTTKKSPAKKKATSTKKKTTTKKS